MAYACGNGQLEDEVIFRVAQIRSPEKGNLALVTYSAYLIKDIVDLLSCEREVLLLP